MKKQKRIMFTLLLAFAVILSMVPLASATEAETEHEHSYQCEGYDEYFHTMVCTICGNSRTTTHTYTETCTVCGYTEHKHTWQFSGETYSDQHGMKCTQCDSTTTENCTFGSNGCCTVCGQAPAHWHDFKWKGKQHSERYHLLECDCGETSAEEHRLVWDGVNRTDSTHGVRCAICGVTRTHGHQYSNAYENGKVCIECGYGSPTHTWEYTGYYDNIYHELFCSHCSRPKYEPHKPNDEGNCSVCGYHVYDVNESETGPTEAKPTETEPTETKPAETKPADPKPPETDQDLNDADDDHNNYNNSSTGNEQNSTGSKNESEKANPKPENTQPTAPADDENTDHENDPDDDIVDNTQPTTELPASGTTETPDEEEIASEVTVPEEPTFQNSETCPAVQDEQDHVHEAATPVINRTSLMALLAIVALLTLAGFLTVVLIKRVRK